MAFRGGISLNDLNEMTVTERNFYFERLEKFEKEGGFGGQII